MKTPAAIEIQDIVNLVSYRDILVEAITTGRQVNVNVNLDDPKEILKGHYLAQCLGNQGYDCTGKIVETEKGRQKLYFELLCCIID